MPQWPVVDEPARERVLRSHKETVGTDPAHVADAPATWSLVGDHIDHYGGIVALGLAQLRAAVAYSPRGDDRIVVNASHLQADGSYAEVRDEVSVDELNERAAAQEPAIDDNGRPIVPDTPEGGAAARLGGIVWTMIHRQLLSRDTPGMDITVVNHIPRRAGLGAASAVDAAFILALQGDDADIDLAPTRTRLAEVCDQADAVFSAVPPLRARHSAELRGREDSLSVIDYADGSVTQAPHPLDDDLRPYSVSLPAEQQPVPTSGIESVRDRTLFLDEACRSFGTDSLRQLPDASQRVGDWLAAVHKVHGPEGVPTLAHAADWLAFAEDELQRAHRLTRALRSRRGADIAPLLNDSHRDLRERYGLDNAAELAQLCLHRGAESARAASAGLDNAVIALVPAVKSANFAADLAADGLTVVRLSPGEPAALH